MHIDLQARLLYGAAHIRNGYLEPTTKLGAAVISIIAHSYDDAFPALVWTTFPEFISMGAPFYCTAAQINKAGQVVADRIESNGWEVSKDSVVFRSTKDMEGQFRRLADALRLNDAERRTLFEAVTRWVVADRRLDPNMNPADPDAKRLTVH